ncbi:MAG: DNA polymerase III subunit delta [Cyclobacteriaceae bacterium]
MPQKPEIVLENLKKNQYAPVYFLQGEEPYFIDLISNYIEHNALQETEKGFNQVIMYGKDVDMSGVITNAKRYPMMSERQVVLVKEAQEMGEWNKQEGQKLLENYISNPLPSTILVFCYKYKTLDGRKSLSKSLDKYAVLVTTKKLYDNQIPAWISNFVKSKGHTIQPKSAQLLADYSGNNLERLSNEINKVLINLDEKVEIDAGHIQKYVGISKEYNVFELQRALTVKDAFKAQQIVNYFAANPRSNPIIPVIAILYGFFAKLLLIHASRDRSERHLASQLRIRPFFVKEYLTAWSNYSLPQVLQNIHHIKMADLKSKGVDAGNLGNGAILKELVFRLLQ